MVEIEKQILDEIKGFCDEHGLSGYKFGLCCVNDHKLVTRLESGKTINSGTINKIREYIGSFSNYRDPT